MVINWGNPSMAKDYYCKIKDKTFGPMTLEELKKMATEGKLKPSDKVESDISPEFLEARTVSFLNSIFNPQSINLDVLEKNSVEIIKRLRAIDQGIAFVCMFLTLYLLLTVIAAIWLALKANAT